MCTITATELKRNMGKYILLGKKERIEVTHRGKAVFVIVPACEEQLKKMYSFVGMVPTDATIGTDPNERL